MLITGGIDMLRDSSVIKTYRCFAVLLLIAVAGCTSYQPGTKATRIAYGGGPRPLPDVALVECSQQARVSSLDELSFIESAANLIHQSEAPPPSIAVLPGSHEVSVVLAIWDNFHKSIMLTQPVAITAQLDAGKRYALYYSVRQEGQSESVSTNVLINDVEWSDGNIKAVYGSSPYPSGSAFYAAISHMLWKPWHDAQASGRKGALLHKAKRLEVTVVVADISTSARIVETMKNDPDWLVRLQAASLCDDIDALQAVLNTEMNDEVKNGVQERLKALR